MSRNIVFCADGTWNQPGAAPEGDGAATNVWKIFGSLAGEPVRQSDSQYFKETADQVALYVDGIGTTRLQPLNLIQGAVGLGVSQKIIDGYLHLSRHFREGDRVYLFGFSRGAYVVRSLAGLISQRGLLVLAGNDTHDETGAWSAVNRFLEHSTKLGGFSDATTAESYANMGTRFKRLGMNGIAALMEKGRRYFDLSSNPVDRPCPVTCVGVWDTVGALGVPVGIFDKASESLFEFQDLDLSENVAFGYHALALDEYREAFQPTLWNPRRNMEQVWFCGAHADVGGGYRAAGLSDYALRWMVAKARNRGALIDKLPPVAPDPAQRPTDSYSRKFGDRRPRAVPKGSALHESVAEKLRSDHGYRPDALAHLAADGDPGTSYRIVTDCA